MYISQHFSIIASNDWKMPFQGADSFFLEVFFLFVPWENQYFFISEPSSFPLSPQSDSICHDACSLSFFTLAWVSSYKQRIEKEGHVKLKSPGSVEVCTRQFIFISGSEWQPIRFHVKNQWISSFNQLCLILFYYYVETQGNSMENHMWRWVEEKDKKVQSKIKKILQMKYLEVTEKFFTWSQKESSGWNKIDIKT